MITEVKLFSDIEEIIANQTTDFEFYTSFDQLDLFRAAGFKVKEKHGKIYKVVRKGKNPFKFSDNHKRYHTLDYYHRQKYQKKIAKVPINGGFTCPNIDGTKGFGGCTFCSIKGSGDFAGHPLENLKDQWEKGLKMMRAKWPDAHYIAYFQAFTNTYAPVEVLQEKFSYFANLDECFGLHIATRADCLDDEIISLLQKINQIKPVCVEIGLQTIHEQTANIINRCHNLACFDEAINKLHSAGLETIVHIINGLPKENKEMMIQTAAHVAQLPIDGIKIHLLYVSSDTPLVNQLNNGFLKLLDKEEYIEIVAEQLALLPPSVVIHRLTGDAPFANFIGPLWSKKKASVINDIDKYLITNNLYQGCKIK